VSDPPRESGVRGELVVQVERIRIAAGGGELVDVLLGDGLCELDAVADAELGWFLRRQRYVPLGQGLVGLDPFGPGMSVVTGMHAEGREGGAVRGHHPFEHV